MPADILIIDDEEIILQSLALVFRQEGLTADTESDPRVALDRYRQHHYGIALVDVVMPGLQGAQVIRAIKDINPLCNIIVMTAFSNMTHVIDCIEAGATDYVTKPFVEIGVLLSVVKSAQDRISRWRQAFGVKSTNPAQRS